MAKTAEINSSESIRKTDNKTPAKPAAKTTKTNAHTPGNSDGVDAYMQKLEHPLKKEMEEVRTIIKQATVKIKEQVKWNAPSFFYKEDLATFNPRMLNAVHIVFHHANIVKIKSPLLQGDYKDRRMMYLHNREEVLAYQTELEKIIRELVEMIDQ